MKPTREEAVVVAACVACCAPLVVAALPAAPIVVAGAVATAIGAGLTRVARQRTGQDLRGVVGAGPRAVEGSATTEPPDVSPIDDRGFRAGAEMLQRLAPRSPARRR